MTPFIYYIYISSIFQIDFETELLSSKYACDWWIKIAVIKTDSFSEIYNNYGGFYRNVSNVNSDLLWTIVGTQGLLVQSRLKGKTKGVKSH